MLCHSIFVVTVALPGVCPGSFLDSRGEEGEGCKISFGADWPDSVANEDVDWRSCNKSRSPGLGSLPKSDSFLKTCSCCSLSEGELKGMRGTSDSCPSSFSRIAFVKKCKACAPGAFRSSTPPNFTPLLRDGFNGAPSLVLDPFSSTCPLCKLSTGILLTAISSRYSICNPKYLQMHQRTLPSWRFMCVIFLPFSQLTSCIWSRSIGRSANNILFNFLGHRVLCQVCALEASLRQGVI